MAIIDGTTGDDTLSGGPGPDQLRGGLGNDRYFVAETSDLVIEAAAAGNDRVFASVNYALSSGQHVETLSTTDNAGTAALNLTGNDLANVILGNAGNNVLNGGGGADTLYGYGGNDWFYVDNAGDAVIEGAGAGTDRVFASVSYVLSAGSHVETLGTTDSAATTAINLTGNALVNIVLGNAGNNTLNGGAGADSLYGYGGNDFYYVDHAGDAVIETAGNGTDRVFASTSFTLGAGMHVETLGTTDSAGTAAINFTGNELANMLLGNAGNNTLNGGAGADSLYGYGGNDFFYVDNAADVVIETAGNGTDRVFASTSFALGGGMHVEMLTTTDAAGTTAINLTGNELVNAIVGNAGANTLNGGAGADTLNGQGGNDFYYVDNAADVVIELASWGTDRVFASVNYTLGANVHVETLSTTSNAGTAALNLTGNELANTLLGNAGNNTLNGAAGADAMYGYGGDDWYYVDNAGDTVLEGAGAGTDRVFASAGYTLGAGVHVETLSTTSNGGTAAIDLTGNELANTILGNAGANVLNGGGGVDTLYGYGGADKFVFSTALGAGNVDAISDFQVGVDKIVLAGTPGSPFAALATGTLGPGHLVFGTAAVSPNAPTILYNAATGALSYDANGSLAGAPVQFATLAPNLALQFSDFEVAGPPNNTPTITSAATASVAENSPTSTIVYQATALDADGDTVIWGIGTSGFTIDRFGAVRMTTSANFEAQSSYTFDVYVQDSAAGPATVKTVTLTIQDVAEATPVIPETTSANDDAANYQPIQRSTLVIAASNPNLPNDDLPSATITGNLTSPEDKDFFGIYVEAGEVIYLDVDYSSGNLDAYLELFAPGGGSSVLLFNDDLGVADPGSDPHPEYGHNTDSYIRVRVNTSGTYLFAVSSFQDPENPTSGSYQLNVSIGPPATPEQILQEDVEALISGSEWDHTNLTYAFPTLASQYPAGIEEVDEPGEFAPLTATQQGAVISHLNAIAAVSGLTFALAGDPATADLRYAMSDNADPAYAYYPTNLPNDVGGTAWFDKINFNDPDAGNYDWMGFMHETGHALGLKHGHESPPISPGNDSLEFTMMTYRSYVGQVLDENSGLTNETFGFPQTLMMLDIAALQQMYGANFATNSGNSVYTWSPTTGEMGINGVGQGAPGENRIFMTLWDGGGTDTYDFSSYSTGVTIDLRPGEWTTTSFAQRANLGEGHYARGNIANALQFENDPRSLIENAIGGSGVDTLNGNAIANTLTGGAGADVLAGFGGNDTLFGGDDPDSLSGGDGNDTLWGGASFDTLFGDAGNDTLRGEGGIDELNGGAGVDLLEGGAGEDSLYGGSENDTLNGGDDRDTLEGGAGDDDLDGGSGDNSLYGGDGNDDLITGAGSDNLFGDAGDDHLVAGDGIDSLTGGAGSDQLFGGLGDDQYWLYDPYDQVIEYAGEGQDRVIVGFDYIAHEQIEIVIAAEFSTASLTGNGLNNELVGNNSNNVLDGAAGSDTLRGWGGADTFAFSTALGGGNVDAIADFVAADDTIRLDDSVFTGLSLGALAAGAFNTGSAATQADDRIIYNSATGALLFDVDGVGGAAGVQFATLTGAPIVSANDFVVV